MIQMSNYYELHTVTSSYIQLPLEKPLFLHVKIVRTTTKELVKVNIPPRRNIRTFPLSGVIQSTFIFTDLRE